MEVFAILIGGDVNSYGSNCYMDRVYWPRYFRSKCKHVVMGMKCLPNAKFLYRIHVAF